MSENKFINLPKNKSIVLIGSGDLVEYALKEAKKYFESIYLVSNSDWPCYDSIKDLSKELGVEHKNCKSKLELLSFVKLKNINIGFSIGVPWIFESDFIDYFNGLLFNYHPTKLPDFRGGGILTWQILNGIDFATATIHQIDSGIDSGPIVINKSHKLNKKPIPNDFFLALSEIGRMIISRFMKQIFSDSKVSLQTQDLNKSSYFPILQSKVNGAIDWSWGIEEIEVFIRGFSYPYAGAYTYKDDIRINIMEASIYSRRPFHPFAVGLIIGKTDNNSLRVACIDGELCLNKIAIDGVSFNPIDILKLGKRLCSPQKILDDAKNFRAIY